ncbi:hypothetical protein GFY24_01440 [Nocardia sp. SYP-A9097]|uniref:esterase/lipase family protein n=1 Tax=Nocardia sp. SYP-A9097 TaxID=2663237 RepID=UPI00129BDF0F|nr:hypothetical protein [Nocardia sp. SYP-A9097]MRH86138.1 hypothetical protein [Nocardia sp. SYP-A9097]
MRMLFTAGVTAAMIGLIATVPAGAEPAGPAPIAGTVAGTTIEPAIDCLPSPAHPHPVVVLPGGDGTTAETSEQWGPVLRALRGAGYCTLVFQGGILNGKRWAGDLPASARQTADFIAAVRGRTGADQVDIVAHSVGTVVSNYFLKVLGGAPQVAHAIFLAPEARGCDGSGFLTQFGIENSPITPAQVLAELPFLAAGLSAVSPEMAVAVQLTPQSEVYHAVFDGPITQPGVRYSVLSTRNDEFATPATTCSVIDEPGVRTTFYEDLFPSAAAVGHSSLRSSTETTRWIVDQLAR